MIVGTIVLIGLLASSASGSAVKGRVADEYRAVKSAAPVDYRRDQYEQRTVAYAAKGAVAAAAAAAAPQAAEQLKLTDSEFYQQREEAKQQFYEAQPQLRETDCKSDLCRKPAQANKNEERFEEQTKLVQAPEQVKYDDYPQQREEAPVQQVKQEVKGLKQEKFPVAYEATKAYDKYEAKPQVREEVPVIPAAAPLAPVVVPVVVPEVRASRVEPSAGYSKTSDEQQVQYTAQVTDEQRYESQRDEASRSLASVKSPSSSVVAQKTEFVQQERQQEEAVQQQAVELTRQQDYEQRRYEEHSEQRAEEQQPFAGQVRETDPVKGSGLRPAGAEAEPYAFDYSVEGSTRREQGDKDGVVRGQYTLSNPDGTQRIVDYVADQDGFRAQVRSNEFGTEGQQAAPAPAPARSAPVYEGKTRYQQEQVAVVAAPAVKSPPAPAVQVTAELVRTGGYRAATKGAALEQAPQQVQQFEVKSAPAPVLQVREPEPYKGQRSEETIVRAAAPQEPIKSAELRTPKAIGYSSPAQRSVVVSRASGFESATAHRPVVHSHPVPVSVVRHQPVVSVVRHQLVSPARGYQSSPQHHHQAYPYRPYQHVSAPVVVGVPSTVSRSQLQHDRYPPASYRRDLLANPRVSFYSNRDIEDDQPAGFEHVIGQI